MNIEDGRGGASPEGNQGGLELSPAVRPTKYSAEASALNPVGQIKPFRQGALDALCGLYAIANAMNRASPNCLSDEQFAIEFFSKMAHAAVRVRGSAGFVSDGLDDRELSSILKSAQKIMQARGYRFTYYRPSGRMLTVWNNSAKKLQWLQRGSIESDTAIILYVEKPSYSHWSVLKGVQAGRVALFDSDTMRSARLDEVEPWVVIRKL